MGMKSTSSVSFSVAEERLEETGSPLASESASSDEEFQTAPESDEEILADPVALFARSGGSRSIAYLSRDDEEDDDVFEEALLDHEKGGDGFFRVARVGSLDQNHILVEKGESSGGAVEDPGLGVRLENSKGDLGIEEESSINDHDEKDETLDAGLEEFYEGEESFDQEETEVNVPEVVNSGLTQAVTIPRDEAIAEVFFDSDVGFGVVDSMYSISDESLEEKVGGANVAENITRISCQNQEIECKISRVQMPDPVNAVEDSRTNSCQSEPETEIFVDSSNLAWEDSRTEKTAANLVESSSLPGYDADEEGKHLATDGPAKISILESCEVGSSSASTHDVDGQIDSDEEFYDDDDDDEGDEKEVFDPAAFTALLKAVSNSLPAGNIDITSNNFSKISSVAQPAGLGSSVLSLRPAAPYPVQPNLIVPSEPEIAPEPENDMNEEEKKFNEKVELIRIKFLRFVCRLGHSLDDIMVARVLYPLSLLKGMRGRRLTDQDFKLDKARKKALQLEAEGKEELNFSCNILVLGKTGVGKSATINSIFGAKRSQTSAFEPATSSVKEIVGTVDGVKIRVIDTPGFKASAMDQVANWRILSAVKKYLKKCSPDIVLYVDRLDSQTHSCNDLPLLRSITRTLGNSIWLNAIVALTHAASAPPDGPNGSPMNYDVFVSHSSLIIQQAIRQAAGDMRLMNPVTLVENHPFCRRNRQGEMVLPSGVSWRPEMLFLCYSLKISSEANSLLKLQDPSPGKLSGFWFRSWLPYLLSTFLQYRAHPKLPTNQGGEIGDLDVDLDDLSDADQEEEEDEYDQLPHFKPLRKSQVAKLTEEQRKAYFDEYDYRIKLFQKKQWKEELRRLKEMKERRKAYQDGSGYIDLAEDCDQDNVTPASMPVPLTDMILPPSFDCDRPTYRYRFLESASQFLCQPVIDTRGWDHDWGYDGINLEERVVIAGLFPAAVSVQVTKDKKDFSIHLDSSISAKHGEIGSTLAGFDIQAFGRQLAYILRGETKFKNLKKNLTTGGVSLTFLGETIATGMKIEDQISIGKRMTLVARVGSVRAKSDSADGANLEVQLRNKDYPIDQSLSILELSLMRWNGNLSLGANLQSQVSVGRSSKMVVQVGLSDKLAGQISIKTSTSEHLQIGLLGILPIISIIKKMVEHAI